MQSAYCIQAARPSVCPSITSRYHVEKFNERIMTFPPPGHPGSPFFEITSTPKVTSTSHKLTPLARDLNETEVGITAKNADF